MNMKKVSVAALLLTFAAIFAAPARAQQAYVWDGSSLHAIQTTQGLTCSNWALWYFKPGVSQSPGNQWGAAVGRSAAEVMEAQRKAQQEVDSIKQAWAQYHMNYHDQHLYENYLGPICVTKSAFDAKPGAVDALERLGESAGRVSNLIRQVRMIISAADGTTKVGYQGFYLEAGKKTQAEEYLNNLQEMAENVGKLQNEVMQRLGPTMMQINGQIGAIRSQLAQADANLPAIRNLISAPPQTVVSTAWMRKAKSSSEGDTYTIQEASGGFSIKQASSSGYETSVDIQYENVSNVTLLSSGIMVSFKDRVRPTTSDGGIVSSKAFVMISFATPQDAKDAYNYLKAQIR
jgi:hypothetical protein